MTDTDKAIKLNSQQSETLQEKLEKIKFVNPINGQAHSWKKSQYVKGLALKVQTGLQLVNFD
jgi:uncharacterized protein YlbG (UPF0298 family)